LIATPLSDEHRSRHDRIGDEPLGGALKIEAVGFIWSALDRFALRG
jgi:hypothetical protein